MGELNFKKINKVELYFRKVLKHCQILSDQQEIKDSDIVFRFMGSGASDNLTIKDIEDFLTNVKEVKQEVEIFKNKVCSNCGDSREDLTICKDCDPEI